jgi:hypothetical protein
MWLSGFEPARLRGFTSEVSHTYGIFHQGFKKGQKATGEIFLDLDYYNYLQAELESAPFPTKVVNVIPKYHQFTAPFSGLGIF